MNAVLIKICKKCGCSERYENGNGDCKQCARKRTREYKIKNGKDAYKILTCSIDGCDNESKNGSKICSRHKSQLEKYGKIISVEMSTRKKNKFIISNDKVEIILTDVFGRYVGVSIIDIDDFDKVKTRRWYMTEHGYCASGEDAIYLHRFILSDALIVDHVNGDKLCNIKSNLRECTMQQNSRNRLATINSKTRIKGVYENSRSSGRKYYAQITIDNKRIHLGCFDSIDDAKKIRHQKEIEIYEEFARIK